MIIMQNSMIKQLFTRADDLIDSLIEDFGEFNNNENVLGFLAEKTMNFINFSQTTFSMVIFGFLDKISDTKYNFDEEISKSKELINKIFENIKEILGHILQHEEDEEDGDCEHDHEHHHHHIDMDSVQEDIDKVVEYLVLLKGILSTIENFVLTSLKYESDKITEGEFKKAYNTFKENINKYYEES